MVRLAAGGAKLLGFLFSQKAEAKGSQNTKTAAHHISTVGDRYAQRRVKTLTNRCTRKTVGKIVHVLHQRQPHPISTKGGPVHLPFAAGGAQFYGPPLALERTPLSPPPNKQHRKNQPKPPKFSQSKATNQRQSTAPSPISAEGTC